MYLKTYISKVFRWEIGRQKTGYDKMLLLTGMWPLPFDLYLLRFLEGSEIPPHVDKVEEGQHYRLNIILKKAQRGGEFICSDTIWNRARVKLFRSDIAEHSVTHVNAGSRYVLSLGWVCKS